MYDKLLDEAYSQRVDTFEKFLPDRLQGLYGDNVIWINKKIQTTPEKACVLAEELGHHYTSYGDILDKHDLNSRKQEKRARCWAYEKIIPLTALVDAYHGGVSNRYEVAEFLEVTESFLNDTLNHYRYKYGHYKDIGEYIIYFKPLGILHKF